LHPICSPDLLREPPRVDIAYSHVGADGTGIQAYVAAGARGIVSAGFGPGMTTPAELSAIIEAVDQGVIVVQSSRTNSGLVVNSNQNQRSGIIAGSDIGPVKARILLALCLARGDNKAEITQQFMSI
jgi:L-asparaginase